MSSDVLNVDNLRKLMEHHSSQFYIHDVITSPTTPAGSGELLVCLQTQKAYLQHAIDVLVAYLIEYQGRCKLDDIHFVVGFMTDEAAQVAASTPVHWKETVMAAAGSDYIIEGDDIVLCDYTKWKKVIDSYNENTNVCGSDDGDIQQEDSSLIRTSDSVPASVSNSVPVDEGKCTNQCINDDQDTGSHITQQESNDTGLDISLDVSQSFSEHSDDEASLSSDKPLSGRIVEISVDDGISSDKWSARKVELTSPPSR